MCTNNNEMKDFITYFDDFAWPTTICQRFIAARLAGATPKQLMKKFALDERGLTRMNNITQKEFTKCVK